MRLLALIDFVCDATIGRWKTLVRRQLAACDPEDTVAVVAFGVPMVILVVGIVAFIFGGMTGEEHGINLGLAYAEGVTGHEIAMGQIVMAPIADTTRPFIVGRDINGNIDYKWVVLPQPTIDNLRTN